ncbi:MAG: Na(+)-translocating NADH-quinone reductase subunit F [Dehalococcoidia bacterium]|nr:Na(+)-translocating NADH-quinone reductase subunit F [Bacillota bacterium]
MNVLPDDLWLEVNRGQTVWEALQNEDVELEGDCGGLGKCGKCKVRILSSIGPPSQESVELLDEDELKQGIRLACRTEINEDTVVYVGESDPSLEYFQILKTGHRPLFHLNPLVDQRPVTLLSSHGDEGFSDLDRIKLAMGPDYEHMKASLHCLRTLPQMLQETQSRGAAVLHENCLMAWQNWAEVGRRYGLVFDLGTSTLVGKLISLTDGSEVAVISRLNGQMKYGSNVISRLQFVKEHSNGLDYLHDLLVRDMNLIIKRLLQVGGLDPNDIFVAVAAGNTTMQHLFLRLNPLGIAEALFAPVLTDGLTVKATDVGLRLHPEALLYMMPMKSGYIGGDLISVILASGVAEQEDEIALGLDLGTNGEIFLGNRKRLLTCSAAAGPALEGARISRGMIARAGAIEAVGFEGGHLDYQIIGNIKPKGICGSGLVDLVAALLHYNLMDHEGLIRPPDGRAANGPASRIINRSGVHNFVVASAEESYDRKPIYLTQRDVRELQLAKAAIAAGIKTLMDELGIRTEDIHRVYLAGALGNYVSPYSAMRIGLIPTLDLKIVTSLGNAASTGASMVLLSREYWQMANELIDLIEHVELSSRLDFNQYFIEEMDFPVEERLDIYREEVGDVMRVIRVDEVMTPNFPTVPSSMSVEKVSRLLRSSGHHGFPVLDENGRLFGVVTVADLEKPLRTGNADLPVGDVATKSPFVVHSDNTLI